MQKTPTERINKIPSNAKSSDGAANGKINLQHKSRFNLKIKTAFKIPLQIL